MTKLIAHRGWSVGSGKGWSENTLEALKKSTQNKDIRGVEIDIRRHPKTGGVVLSHNPIKYSQKYTTLSEALAFAKEQEWQVLIELKEYDKALFNDVVRLIKKYNLDNRVPIFGFIENVRNLPWQDAFIVDMGITVRYPWHIREVMEKHNPSTILLGWDYRMWTKIAFKAWWSIFSVKTLSKKYGVNIISGIAQNHTDVEWLLKRDIKIYTLDMENAQ